MLVVKELFEIHKLCKVIQLKQSRKTEPSPTLSDYMLSLAALYFSPKAVHCFSYRTMVHGWKEKIRETEEWFGLI